MEQTIEELTQQVNIKAPEFMETAVNGWFTILEAQFHLRNVTASKTKLYAVISSLPAEEVGKIPNTTLASQDYEEIKQTPIEAHERTKPELLEKLMSATTITGRPSAYLHEMLSVAKRIGISDDIVRHKFLQALHSSISPVVASQKDVTHTQLGRLADELMPLLNNDKAFVVQRPVSTKNNSQTNYTGKYNHDTSVPIGVRPYRSNQRTRICRAHIYYANEARTCKPWCKWPKKNGVQVLLSSRPASPTESDSEN